MKIGTSKILGLALRERSILAAEVRISGERREATRMEEFALPPELSLVGQPEALGKALRHFLRQHGFSAGRAVVGVPARWLVAREKDVPPATPATAANVLRLAAEREFLSELKEMVFDYAGQPDPAEPRKVLLVAMLREHLDHIETMAEAAGLSLAAVTPSALALAGAANKDGELSILLGGGAADLAGCGERSPRMLRHLPMADGLAGAGGAIALLGGEIQRAISTIPAQAGVSRLSGLVVWDGTGFDEPATARLAERTGVNVQVPRDLSRLDVRTTAEPVAAARFAPAIALAVGGAQRGLLPMDFSRSRLAPPRTRRFGRRTRWAVGAAALVAVALGWLIYDVQARQGQLDGLLADLQKLEPQRAAAAELATKVNAANGWYPNGRSPYLACLRQVTAAFGDDNNVWDASLSLKEEQKAKLPNEAAGRVSYRGTINGKASAERSMNDLVKRIQEDKASFGEVKLENWQHVTGTGRETIVAFTVTFVYVGSE